MKIAFATLRLANASICSHQKNAAQEGEGLDFKKATSRIFEIINILSLLRITLTCRQSRRNVSLFKLGRILF